MSGGWIPVASSWVDAVRFVRPSSLYVRFRHGTVCRYDGIPYLTYRQMLDAGSKGKFVWQRLYHHPYTVVA